MKKIGILLVFVMLVSGCQSEEKKVAADKTLCDCVASASGAWDLTLTDTCIQRCVETFGESLNGMETWFQENCPEMKIEPPKPAPIQM